MRRYFSVLKRKIEVGSSLNNYLRSSIEKAESSQKFSKLSLSFPLIDFASSRFTEPSPIQKQAIPVLLKGSSALISAETGTGKTLAYLFPTIVRMQASEQKRIEESIRIKGPRIVILSPTRELNSQIITEAKNLAHYAKFKARVWGIKNIKLGKEVCPDLVVATPEAFLKENAWNFNAVESLILDECDAMLFKDSGFTDDIMKIVSKIPLSAQIICVGATALKGDSINWLKNVRPDAVVVKTDTVGALPPSIKLKMSLVTDSEGYNKHPALERTLSEFNFQQKEREATKTVRCMIFCNSISSCRSTHYFLTEKFSTQAESFCLHGDMRPMQRDASWNGFATPSETTKVKILVCTDLSSRGIDVRNVDHVILFDIPYSLPDVLHRAGRTGRAGKVGEVTFIVGRGEKQKVKDLFNEKL